MQRIYPIQSASTLPGPEEVRPRCPTLSPMFDDGTLNFYIYTHTQLHERLEVRLQCAYREQLAGWALATRRGPLQGRQVDLAQLLVRQMPNSNLRTTA